MGTETTRRSWRSIGGNRPLYLGGDLGAAIAGGLLDALASLLQDLAVGELFRQLFHVHLPAFAMLFRLLLLLFRVD